MPDSTQWVLFRGTDKIGLYEETKQVYRRVNTDGTLSDPAPRPWRTNPGLVPAPVAQAPRPTPRKEVEQPPQQPPPATAMVQAPEAAQPEEVPTEEEASSLETKLGVPRWGLFAAGGGLAGLALALGLVAQVRRP